MENNSIRWEWTQPYTAWQPMANYAHTHNETIEQELETEDLVEARAVLARIMAL
jgi:hypothetical protein